MSIIVLAEQIFIFMSIILLGFAAEKVSILDANTTQKLSSLIMNICMPCILLSLTSQVRGASARDLLVCIAVFAGYFIVAIIIMEAYSRTAKLERGKRAVINSMVVFPNIAFIGIPLVSALLGEGAVIYNAIAMTQYNLFFILYVPAMFEKGGRPTLRSVATPINISAVIMIVMILFGAVLPDALQATASQVGQATTPLALMMVGAMLGRSNLRGVLKNKQLYFISILRLLVFPTAFAYIISLLGLPRQMFMSCVIAVSCASGNLSAVVALQKNVEAAFASEAVVHATVLSAVTMPVVILLAGRM